MSVAPHIVSLYAALLAFAFVGLSIRTLRLRKRLRIVIGDAGDTSMLRAMRVHANFAEYVPLALVLMLLVEAAGGAGWLVHVLGVALLLGRAAHAWGVSQVREDFRFRVFGMAMTFGVLLVSAIWLLVHQAAALGA